MLRESWGRGGPGLQMVGLLGWRFRGKGEASGHALPPSTSPFHQPRAGRWEVSVADRVRHPHRPLQQHWSPKAVSRGLQSSLLLEAFPELLCSGPWAEPLRENARFCLLAGLPAQVPSSAKGGVFSSDSWAAPTSPRSPEGLAGCELHPIAALGSGGQGLQPAGLTSGHSGIQPQGGPPGPGVLGEAGGGRASSAGTAGCPSRPFKSCLVWLNG